MRNLYAQTMEGIIREVEGQDIGVAPSGKLTVSLGDTVRVTLSVSYRGPAVSGKIHIAFGQKDTLFNEDGNKLKEDAISFGPDSAFKVYTITRGILIGGNTGTNYDLYAKLMSLPGADIFTPTYMNVLDVIGAPEFQDFKITDYSKV